MLYICTDGDVIAHVTEQSGKRGGTLRWRRWAAAERWVSGRGRKRLHVA